MLASGNKHIKYHALGIIGTITNLVELVWVENMTSDSASLQFKNIRYPCPLHCIYDQALNILVLISNVHFNATE